MLQDGRLLRKKLSKKSPKKLELFLTYVRLIEKFGYSWEALANSIILASLASFVRCRCLAPLEFPKYVMMQIIGTNIVHAKARPNITSKIVVPAEGLGGLEFI